MMDMVVMTVAVVHMRGQLARREVHMGMLMLKHLRVWSQPV